MAAFNYSGLVSAVETLLLGQLPTCHVSQEPADATEMQCPAVLIRLDGFTREPTRIVGLGTTTGNPYEETIRLTLSCTAFSVEGPADAARQRDALVRQVIDALATDPTVGGRVYVLNVLSGDADTFGESAGIFARMTLACEAQTQA